MTFSSGDSILPARNRFVSWFPWMVLWISLISCTGAQVHWEDRWLKGIPCRLPCWEGVTPGETSADDAVEILRKSPIISKVKIQDSNRSYSGGIDWDWAAGGLGGSAYFNNGKPQQTILWTQLSLPPFTLAEVIQAYGEPSHIVARRRDNTEARETGRTIYDLHFVYVPYGFFLSENRLSSKPTFGRQEVFSTLTLFVPTAQGFSDATGIPPEFLAPWQGFQTFDVYCRDERTLKPCY